MSMSDISDTARRIKSENPDEKDEKFSEFLWKLEKKNEISEEERDSYIGIYRLISQVEQSDGAVIGSLVNQGADITMKICLQRSGYEERVPWTIRWTIPLPEWTV